LRGEPLHTVIVGGGVAGLETMMALRAVADSRVRITLVTPEEDFVYRPLSVGEPFGLGAPHRHPLKRIVRDFDTELVHDELDRVAGRGSLILTRGGVEIAYDALVLALGARPYPAWKHVLTFTGEGDAEAVHALASEVDRGEVESIAFVVPAGVTWAWPLYELALLTAQRAHDSGAHPALSLFTPEPEPLAVFGHGASAEVAVRLEAAGVRFVSSATVDVTPDADVVLADMAAAQRFDRVVAVPRLEGPWPRGVPHDAHGFIPIDTHGRVHGAENIYAAGDGTNFPVKQGGIASQQADAVAQVIGKRAGAGNDPRAFPGVLRGQLLTGDEPLFMRADLSLNASKYSRASGSPPWWPVAKIAGIHLAPYFAADEAAEPPAAPEPEASERMN